MNAYDYINTIWRAVRLDANGRLDGIIEKGSITPVQASGATQFALSDQATNETTVLHTVNGGVTFHLVSWSVTLHKENTSIYTARLFVTDNGDNFQYDIARYYTKAERDLNMAGCMPVPLTIATGWKIKLISDNADMHIYGFIHGYEI